MEIRVNVLGKVAYKENERREDAEKAELYPFGEGLYAVMDGENFVELRFVSDKKHFAPPIRVGVSKDYNFDCIELLSKEEMKVAGLLWFYFGV